MRFDTLIYFQRVSGGEYDPNTGNYAPDTVTETPCFADVTDSSEQTLRLVYGEIRQGSLTVRLQTHYTNPFDRIRIGDKLYKVDSSRLLRIMHVLVVSEVQ